MAQLILRDKDGIEVGRRHMDAGERYAMYESCSNNTLISFEGKRYRLSSVAWKIPESSCVLCVTFDSWEPNDC